MACPWEVIWPEVGDLVLLVDLQPSPQDVQVWGSLDEVPSLGGFLDAAVEAEEQEDVAAAGRPACSGGSGRCRLGRAYLATVARLVGLSGTDMRRSSGRGPGGLGLVCSCGRW